MKPPPTLALLSLAALAGCTGGTSSSGGQGGSDQGGGGGSDLAVDPLVTINHPGDGECRVVGDAFPVIGVATDPQDGDLAASLGWNDSLEGNIGTGAMFDFAPQVTGTHVITASVTDADGNSGDDQVTLEIQQACP